MKLPPYSLGLIAGSILTFFLNTADAAECKQAELITIGEPQYESGAFNAALAREIIERGFNCLATFQSGETLALIDQLALGKIDLLPEVWLEDAPPNWNEALAAGNVVALGTGQSTASEGWYVPTYVAQENAISTISDLKLTTTVFNLKGDEKARFYNCPFGSFCQIVNSRKLKAYGLSSQFIDYVPESYGNIEKQVIAATTQHKPILFYFWEPSSLIASGLFLKLTEPTYDRKTWLSLMTDPDPRKGCASPTSKVTMAANSSFANRHQRIAGVFQRMGIEPSLLRTTLQTMATTGSSPREAAIDFLKIHYDVWNLWVDELTGQNIRSTF
jgi:glycine betaine/proline transport system substrate-binding protein